MKQFLIIVAVIISLVSCGKKENKMHSYLVTFSYPSTIINSGTSTTPESKMDVKYIGQFTNDSLIDVYVKNEKDFRDKHLDKQLKEYYSIKPKHTGNELKDRTEETIADIKKASLRSRIGEWKFIIVFSDSLLNAANGNYEEIIKNYEKSYNDIVKVYEIYDGTELASELECNYIESWYKKHNEYLY